MATLTTRPGLYAPAFGMGRILSPKAETNFGFTHPLSGPPYDFSCRSLGQDGDSRAVSAKPRERPVDGRSPLPVENHVQPPVRPAEMLRTRVPGILADFRDAV